MYVSPAETVDTVNISTSNFDAEQGMAGGAAVTVVTKSGTNQFKGSAFEFFNSDKLNATPVLLRQRRRTRQSCRSNGNIFGGTVGGPIAQNRLFFFGSYEGYKSEQSLFTFFNVPDARAARRRLQPRAERRRVAAGHLQPVHRQSRRHRKRSRSRTTRFPPSCIDPIALQDHASFSDAQHPAASAPAA